MKAPSLKLFSKAGLFVLLQIVFVTSMLTANTASMASKGSSDSASCDKGSSDCKGSSDRKGSGSKECKGSSDKGSSDKGSSDKGSKDKDSKDKGSKDKGSKDKGSKDKGSSDKGSSDKGSSDAEDCGQPEPVCSAEDDDSDKGSSDKGSSDKESKGSSDKGSKDKGSKDKGSKDKGSKDKGSKDKGSKDKGSSDKGSSDQDQSGPCVSTVIERDFGDAPASYGDASHIIAVTGNPFIGAVAPDAEAATTVAPDSDDSTGAAPDDEGSYAVTDVNDPASFDAFACGDTISIRWSAQPKTLYVPVTGDGALYGWIDWDANGTFDVGEEIVSGQSGVGMNRIAIPLSPTASVPVGVSTTYMRLRYSSQTGFGLVGPTGELADGEVEDCQITLNKIIEG